MNEERGLDRTQDHEGHTASDGRAWMSALIPEALMRTVNFCVMLALWRDREGRHGETGLRCSDSSERMQEAREWGWGGEGVRTGTLPNGVRLGVRGRHQGAAAMAAPV